MTTDVETRFPVPWTSGAPVGECLERVGYGVEDFVFDVNQRRRRSRRLARLGRDGRQHVADIASRLALGDELRPVGDDQALVPLPRDVSPGDDARDPRVRRSAIRVDPADDRPRMVGEAEGAEEHPGDAHIIDERLVAEGELACLVFRGPGTDPTGPIDLGGRPAGAGRGRQADRLGDLEVPGAPAEVPGQGADDLLA